MLEVKDLHTYYGAIHALKGVSISVPQGKIVTLIGSNGAGKSTTLRALSGIVKAAKGSISFLGRDLTREPPHRIVALGLCHSPEGRRVFARLTVRENLEMGAYLRHDRAGISADLDHSFQLFPRLNERQKQLAGTLSGGEQQMLAIARALMGRPKLLLLDEPSLGIAPILVQEIFRTIKRINQEQGMTILLVEQNANQALRLADYAYVLETGSIALSGPAHDLAKDERVQRAYLGH